MLLISLICPALLYWLLHCQTFFRKSLALSIIIQTPCIKPNCFDVNNSEQGRLNTMYQHNFSLIRMTKWSVINGTQIKCCLVVYKVPLRGLLCIGHMMQLMTSCRNVMTSRCHWVIMMTSRCHHVLVMSWRYPPPPPHNGPPRGTLYTTLPP